MKINIYEDFLSKPEIEFLTGRKINHSLLNNSMQWESPSKKTPMATLLFAEIMTKLNHDQLLMQNLNATKKSLGDLPYYKFRR
ncbi:Uncharacterised protein [Rodentibacter pneumotropicus]|uniref:Uncharacterized protein n=1 Tax=Rodentibacter pneumotropicus TaxID=758 RepID=A0A3S4UA02_9PAST|nr:Uncharacterised protein [Rodentibacter pneumotropicus]